MIRTALAIALVAILPAAALAVGDTAGRAGAGGGVAVGEGARPAEKSEAIADETDQAAPLPAFVAGDPKTVLEALRDYGLRASLGRTDNGNPMIESRTSRADFVLVFYGCTHRKNCSYAVLNANWEVGDHDAPDEVAAAWNREKVTGRAWTDEDGEVIGVDETVLLGNLTREAFDETMNWWSDTLEEFWKFLDANLYQGDQPDTYDASARDI
jgi:hypothetical protein